MPSGYTSDLHDGEQSFADYAWGVARGFGALVTMRDAPRDAPIPETFEPSSYYVERLAEARAELDELRAASEADLGRRQVDEIRQAEEYRTTYIQEREARRERYEAVLAEAEAWQPPTADHVEFKNTMVQQLRQSIEFDCDSTYEPSIPVLTSVAEYRETLEANLLEEIERAKQALVDERARALLRTTWVQALRDALPEAVASEENHER